MVSDRFKNLSLHITCHCRCESTFPNVIARNALAGGHPRPRQESASGRLAITWGGRSDWHRVTRDYLGSPSFSAFTMNCTDDASATRESSWRLILASTSSVLLV